MLVVDEDVIEVELAVEAEAEAVVAIVDAARVLRQRS